MANRLQVEISPYLLQHAHNPVDWYAWSDEAFKEAKEKNKPILISIGYAACHWCHVMEHESFEDDIVAAYMNEHFVNIKVDREELPAVDHFYMDALQAMNGQGGWPLNVFVTPDKKPFYGGTYFPPQPLYNRISWMDVLQRIQYAWVHRGDEISAQAEQLTAFLKNAANATQSTELTPFSNQDLTLAVKNLLHFGDKECGGFGGAPKFPGIMSIQFLLETHWQTNDTEALNHAMFSVDALLRGGIYDCIGAGMCRYTVDKEWLIPHFEKMLYDNALLLSVLCDAYASTKKEVYSIVIDNLFSFLNRELKSDNHLYFCAIDADADGEEGAFYYWAYDELKSFLNPEEMAFVESHLDVSGQGNWEGKNILHVDEVALFLKEHTIFENVRNKILQQRAKRNRPLTDDKALLSWNALLNWSLAKAARVLQNSQYLLAALSQMQSILDLFDISGTPGHVYKNGQLKHMVNLDDYVFLSRALIELNNATGDHKWLDLAKEILHRIDALFYHKEQQVYFFSSATNKEILVQKIDEYDGSIPSSNAVLSEVLMVLGIVFNNQEWIAKADHLMLQIKSKAIRNPYSYAFWNVVARRDNVGYQVLHCNESQFQKIKSHYLPVLHYAVSAENIEIEGKTKKEVKGEEMLLLCNKVSCTNLSVQELRANISLNPFK